MRTTLLQIDIVAGNPEANRSVAEAAIASAPASDLYVLPEMWTTGYAPVPHGVAETDDSSLRWMQQMALQYNAAIAGSLSIVIDGKCHNRLYFVTPTGVEYYDKRHLFSYSGENLHYVHGHDRVVVLWRGARILLQVCYDLRFPVFSRNSNDPDRQYDMALYVASWPASRRRPWDVLLQARAIENQCYVCGVNRIGHDAGGTYNGGTVAIDPYGRIIAVCPDNTASSITFDTDIEALDAFRRKFPVLADADQVISNSEW